MPQTNKIIIVGTGGFAKEITFLLSRLEDYELVGYVDDNKDKLGDFLLGKPIIGDSDYLLDLNEGYQVAIGIADPQIKKRLCEKLQAGPLLKFPNLIDPSVLIGLDIKMGIGNIIMANTSFTSSIELGNFNMINIGSTIGHDVRMGNYNSLFPSVNVSGYVNIKDRVSIGVGSKIIQEVTIENDAIIGAGSVVIRDIANNTKNVGVPTRVIEG